MASGPFGPESDMAVPQVVNMRRPAAPFGATRRLLAPPTVLASIPVVQTGTCSSGPGIWASPTASSCGGPRLPPCHSPMRDTLVDAEPGSVFRSHQSAIVARRTGQTPLWDVLDAHLLIWQRFGLCSMRSEGSIPGTSYFTTNGGQRQSPLNVAGKCVGRRLLVGTLSVPARLLQGPAVRLAVTVTESGSVQGRTWERRDRAIQFGAESSSAVHLDSTILRQHWHGRCVDRCRVFINPNFP